VKILNAKVICPRTASILSEFMNSPTRMSANKNIDTMQTRPIPNVMRYAILQLSRTFSGLC